MSLTLGRTDRLPTPRQYAAMYRFNKAHPTTDSHTELALIAAVALTPAVVRQVTPCDEPAIDRTPHRCPADGAWLMTGQVCACCTANERRRTA